MDCFHLIQDVIDALPQLGSRAAYAKQRSAMRSSSRQYINGARRGPHYVLGWNGARHPGQLAGS